ncbi:MAG: alginate export family protein [Methylobacter sp.]
MNPIIKKNANQAILLSGLLLAQSTPAAEPQYLGQINDHLRISGDMRIRYENWDFFDPATTAQHENSYDFVGHRIRLGALLTSSYVDGFVQGEYSGVYGLPNNATVAPAGALGTGATYYNDSAATVADVHLKQVYLSFKGDPLGLAGLRLKLGRYEIADGLEYKTGNAKFDGLKTTRVSQRLLGPFDFTYATRNFDGIHLAYDKPAYNLTVAAAHPTQGGFNIHGQDDISHIDVFYAALTGKKDVLLPGTEQRLFYIYYGDDRNTQAVDNRAAALRPNLSRQDLQLHTIGSHWLGVWKAGEGSVDGLLWGAYQFGDWAGLNHQAGAIDAELGYQWDNVPLKPWIRAVYFRSSGDSNAGNGSHGTFFQMLPTGRPFAKFPFYNLMNIQDAFAQFIVIPTETTKVAVDVHHLSLDSSQDLFYSGAGATLRSGSFGYAGRNAGGASDIGQLVDIGFSHQLNRYFSWNAYYGHVFGGEVLKNVYGKQADADYGFVELNAAF